MVFGIVVGLVVGAFVQMAVYVTTGYHINMLFGGERHNFLGD